MTPQREAAIQLIKQNDDVKKYIGLLEDQLYKYETNQCDIEGISDIVLMIRDDIKAIADTLTDEIMALSILNYFKESGATEMENFINP